MMFGVTFRLQQQWSGLETCVRLLRRAGLQLVWLRLHGQDVRLRLTDDGQGDLQGLQDDLTAATGVDLLGWTVLLQAGPAG